VSPDPSEIILIYADLLLKKDLLILSSMLIFCGNHDTFSSGFFDEKYSIFIQMSFQKSY